LNLERLLEKLPTVRVWIADIIRAHENDARSLASYGFPRLRLFFSADVLARVRVVEVPRVPFPPVRALGLPEFGEFEDLDMDAATFGDTYFLRPNRATDEALHFHELVHVLQWEHLGPERFLMTFGVGYLIAGNNVTNPLEALCCRLQDRFVAGAAPFSVEDQVRSQAHAILTGIRP